MDVCLSATETVKVFLPAKLCALSVNFLVNINMKPKLVFIVNKMYDCQRLLYFILLVPCSYYLNYVSYKCPFDQLYSQISL